MRSLYKVVRFNLDKNLAYLIQATTTNSTCDILNYFTDIAHSVILQAIEDAVARDAAGKGLPQRINKNITLFYKETTIPWRMGIVSNHIMRSCRIDFYISVTFPKSSSYLDFNAEVNRKVEAGLGLSSAIELPLFEKPKLRATKALQKIRKEQNERTK